MQWLVFALLTALIYSAISLIIKEVVKDYNPDYFAMALSIVACFLHIPFIIILKNYIWFNTTFILWLIPTCIIGAAGRFLVTKALKVGNISKTIPILSLTPLFALPFGIIFSKELPGAIGIMGIFLIVAGTYILDIEKLSKHVLAPFKYIFTHPGTRMAFIVAVIYGVGINIDKVVLRNSNPITFALLYIYVLGLFQFIYLFLRDKRDFSKNIKKVFNKKIYVWLFIIGLLSLTMIFFQVTTLSLTFAAYVSAIKRISGIFAVIAGFFIFNEKKHFWTTLAGAIIMVIGTIFLTL